MRKKKARKGGQVCGLARTVPVPRRTSPKRGNGAGSGRGRGPERGAKESDGGGARRQRAEARRREPGRRDLERADEGHGGAEADEEPAAEQDRARPPPRPGPRA